MMASIEEAQTSIQQYELQLSQVDQALRVCTNDTERASLENLKCDLEEILNLTRETLNELNGSSNGGSGSGSGGGGGGGGGDDENVDEDDDDDPYAQEMAIFLAEINDCNDNNGNTSKSTAGNSSTVGCDTIEMSSKELEKFKSELDTIIGKKCSAPYTFAWGARSYHNALICGMETDIQKIHCMDDIQVIVLFTNPIHRNMVPCPFYLDGNCRFEINKCRFSHGEIVRYIDLKDYNKPNFSLLNQTKHPVLAKQTDNIWYKGRVVSSDFNDKTCIIRFEHTKKETKCDFHDILPIEEETPFIASETESDGNDEDDDDEENDVEQIVKANLIEKSLLTPAPDQKLGAWEAHTKGFGSRMLQKFGYVIGTGLGQNGEGIIVPISAQVLPPGRSLDHCMTLREQANGDKDLFSVEKKWKSQQERQERQNVKAYEREKQKDHNNVFNFLNQNILNNMPSTSGLNYNTVAAQTAAAAAATNAMMMKDTNRSTSKSSPNDYKTQTNRKLNVESLKIGEDIRKMEREIQKLQESLRRHKDGTQMSQQLNMQLDIRKTELDRMKKSESSLQKEQNIRKDKTKLTIF